MEIRLKRFLSLAMAIIMVIGMMPTNVVFAEETESCDHNYADGVCGVCGAADPDYVAPHQHTYQYACSTECSTCTEGTREATHTYVDGKCECGETDPNYQPPHQHSFVEGKCTCGETDPDWTPADGAKNGDNKSAPCEHDWSNKDGVCAKNCGTACEHNFDNNAKVCATCGVANPNYTFTVALPGSFNDNSMDGNTVAINEIAEFQMELEAGNYTFKVSEDGINLGYNGQIDNVTGNSGVVFTESAGACTLAATGGNYTFKFYPETNTLTVSCTAASGGEGGDEIPPEDTAIDTEAELIAAIAKGGEVVLEGDITTNEMITVAGTTVTLDLNGYTITAGTLPANENMVLWIQSGATMTIVDSGENGGIVNNSTYGYAILNQGTLTVKGGTFVGDTALWNGYDTINAVANIEGGVFKFNGEAGAGYSIGNAGTLNVAGGTITDWLDSFGTLSIERGDVEYIYLSSSRPSVAQAKTSISGGAISSVEVDEENAASITGGIFDEAPDASYVVNGATITVGGKTMIKTESGLGEIVAKIGETPYISLADAVAAGGEIVVLKDIVLTEGITVPAGKTVVLDLNGKTVSYTSNANGWDALIKNSGNLTIKDSGENGKLVFTPTNTSTSYAVDTIENNGVLTVLGGTIENTVGTGASYTIHNNSSGANATLNVSGGTIIGAGTAIRQYANSASCENNITISGGTITGSIPVRVHVFAADGNGKLEITGGTLNATDTTYNLAIDIQGYNNCSGKNASVAIKGGTLNGSIMVSNVSNMTNGVVISGGTVNGAYGVYDYTDSGIITINGGTFASGAYDYILYYAADGYEPVANTDGTYVISKIPPAAKIGDVEYMSLEAAIADAESGDTIVLMQDVTLTDVVAIPGMILDLNGKTINGDVVGKISINNGTYITSQGLEMMGPNADNYKTSDAVVTIEGATANITLHSGSMELVRNPGWTLPGQLLTIEETASFKIPENVTLNVRSTVIVEGTVEVKGTVDLFTADATVKAPAGLNVITTVADRAVAYVDGTYKVAPATAKIGEKLYASVTDAAAAAKDGETITLLADATLTEALVIPGKTLDLNGKTIKGDVLGTIKINSGTYYTSQNYKMMGPDADYYKTTDAVLTMVDINGSITLHSGSMEQVPELWWTLDQQTLTVGPNATFTIPAGKTLNVRSAVIVEGNVVVAGTVNLYEATATVKAPAGLNVVTTVEYCEIDYANGTYSVKQKEVDVKVPENVKTDVPTDVEPEKVEKVILEITSSQIVKEVDNLPANTTLVIEPVSVTVEKPDAEHNDDTTEIVTTKIIYDVTPVVNGVEQSELGQEVTFRLPIPGSINSYIKQAVVTHKGVSVTKDILPKNAQPGDERYVEVSSSNFSEFEVELIDVSSADVAQIGTKGYATLPAAFAAAKTGDTIKLLKNVELTAGMSILEKNLTLDLNGKTFKGDILGTIAINGGTYITSQNYKMMGPDADYYKTTDAVFSMTDIKGSITLHSGNVIMVPDEWWTLEGQTLTIDAGATFEIPAGKTLQVLSTVIVNGTVKVDGTVNLYIASATVKAAEGLNIVTSVADHKVVYQDGTYKVVPKVYVAQIGETKYESVADALAAAVEAGMTDVTITLIGETTQTSAVALDDAFNLYTLEKFNSVTINQADATKPYYIAGIYTGSRTNGGKFIFDGVNITVIDQYIFEGNVALTNNSVVKSVSKHNCFNYYGNVTVEPGSKLLGVIDEARGGKYTIDGGKTDGSYNTTPDMQDAILSISWNGDSITLKNGAYVKVNSANEVGRMTLGAGAVANIVASKLDAWEYINMAAGSAMNMDTESLITTKKVTGTGVITIDAANMTESVQVINANMSGFAGTIEVINNEYALYEITETGVMVVVGAASVNGKAYKTLTDAFAAVNENTEESVVMNITAGTYAPTANEQLIVTRDNVTIQGAGQDKTTIACGDFTCAGQAGLLIQGSNVTVKDLTVTSSATNAIKVTKIENNNSLPMVKNVAITNVTATSTKGHGLNLHGVEGAAINGLTATGSKCGIALASATGVEISGTKAAGGWVGGTASIGMMYADGAAYAVPCELTLGENNELGLIYSERSTEAKDEITLTAAAPATLRINNLTVAAGEEFLPEGVTEAKVGNYYASLANAMAVAKEGDTVELLTDVEIGTQLVLDKQLITLSGGEEKHTIKAAAGFVKGEYSKHLIDVRADGIVVKDLFIDGNNLASGIQFYGCQANIGNVTVENAKGWAAMQLNGAMLEIFDDVDVSSTSNTWPLIAVEYGAHNPARETVLIVSTDATVDGMIYIDPNGAKLAESQGVQMTVSGELDPENVSAVARIDSTYYGNLEAAVKAAREGDVVEVLTDVTLTERIEITKDIEFTAFKPVTITVSIASGSTGEPFGGLHVTNGTLSLWGDLTVTNVGSQDGGVSTITATGANANVIVDSATVKSECKNNAIEASNGAYITINGGEVLGTQYTAAYASGGATIHVRGGVVKAEGKYGLIASKTAATTGGNIIISGGEVTHVLVHESADSSAIIYGGKIYGTVKAANGAIMHIVAGWFENSPLNKEGVTLDPGMTWTEDNKYIHHGEYVAFIDADDDGIVDEGEQGFATIEDALKAEGKTIKLLNHVKKSLTIENDVTLDLNGYTIETALTGTNDSAIHVKSGKVVITDNSGSGEFVIQATGNGFAMVIDAGANVTLDNVIMVGHSAGVVTYGNLTLGENAGVTATEITEGCGDGVRAYGNAVVTLNGGVAVAAMEDMEHGYGIALYQNAKAIINDGAAAGKSGVCVYGGTLEVNGGYVVGGTEYAILTSSYGDDSVIGSAKVTINDGIVVGKIVVEKDYLNKDLSDYSASVSIKGGQFEGIELIVEDETKDIYSLEVSGGIFENPVPEKYCAPGYIPCENENGTYGVVLNTTRIIDLSNVHDSKINSSEIFVDGVEYTIVNNKIEIDRELAKKTAMFVTSYEYKTGTAGEYPSAMYVWFVKGVDNDGDGVCDTYAAERVSALDNFFQYHGTSIRVGTAKNGIRFFSSVNAADAEKLMKGTLITSGNLNGAKMVKAGTWFKITKEGRSEVYGGAVGNSFRVFQTDKGRNWFTGVLTGLDSNAAKIKEDISSRPYADIQIGNETISLYGGIVVRSIYDVATQNKDVFTAGTAHDDFIENLIKLGNTSN